MNFCLDILHGCDIDQGQFLDIGVLQAGHECPGGIHSGQDINARLDGCPADEESVSGVLYALGRGIDDKVDLVAEDQVEEVR